MDYHDWPSPEDCPHSDCSRRKSCTALGRVCSGRWYELEYIRKLDCSLCPIRSKCQAGKFFDYGSGTWKQSKPDPGTVECGPGVYFPLENNMCTAAKKVVHKNWGRRDVRIEQTAYFPIFATGTDAEYHKPGPPPINKKGAIMLDDPDSDRKPRRDKSRYDERLRDADIWINSDDTPAPGGYNSPDSFNDNPRAMDTSEQPDFPLKLKAYGVRSHHRLPDLVIDAAGHIVCDVDDRHIVENAVWSGREWSEDAFNWKVDGWIGREWYEADANARAYSKDIEAERIRKRAGWPRRRRYLKPMYRGLQKTLTAAYNGSDTCRGPDGETLAAGPKSLLFLPKTTMRSILWFLLHTTKSQREIAEHIPVQRRQVRAMVKRINGDLIAFIGRKKRRRRLGVPVVENGVLVGKRPVLGTLLPPLGVMDMKLQKRKTNAEIARRYGVTPPDVSRMIENFEKNVCFEKAKVNMLLIK